MEKIFRYASWASNAVEFNPENRVFTFHFENNKKAVKALKIDEIIVDGRIIGNSSIFNSCKSKLDKGSHRDASLFSVEFDGKNTVIDSLKITFLIGYNSIEMSVNSGKDCTLKMSSEIFWGDRGYDNTYPISTSENDGIIRCAVGPASSYKSDALFDRLSDTAIKFSGTKDKSITFDWKEKKYILSASIKSNTSDKLIISAENELLTNAFNINYLPMNKDRTFSLPPIGWMTWYAVKFDASEEKVLKNAKWMSENLKKFGANCVWVDWEWGHKDMSGSRSDGTDIFNPDINKYPHGLKYVSDKIREMGLIPSLWIGFTNETSVNDYMKENPDIVLVDEVNWCGRYFFDFSHPKYLNEFLPLALSNVKEWGYDAVKYDTLPLSMTIHDKYHHLMHNSALTTYEAYRAMIQKTRQVLGEKCYMLACSGYGDCSVTWACDVFDSARIGGDIFKWEEFIKEGISPTLHYYPLHNNVMYLDCDNVVMREEFNNIYQAASRIYFVSMLGLPITFGDEFDVLDEQRISFIKSCIPVLDIHPTELNKLAVEGDVLKINLSIEKEWESYNVLNVFNISSKKKKIKVNLNKDLDLPEGDYLVFDYTSNEFLGVFDKAFEIKLEACQSKIFSIRKKLNIPQIISTSRHISQGAAEINNLVFNKDDCTLTVNAQLVAENPYEILIYVPNEFKPSSRISKLSNNVYKADFFSEKNVSEDLIIKFKKS